MARAACGKASPAVTFRTMVVRQGRFAAEGAAGTYLKASLGTSSISRTV
jgi:hypothetical protein